MVSLVVCDVVGVVVCATVDAAVVVGDVVGVAIGAASNAAFVFAHYYVGKFT